MKVFFALLLSLLALVAHAQIPAAAYQALPKDSASQMVSYSAVVQTTGVGKDELFNRARIWAARTFADSKEAGRVEDKDLGTVLYRGTFATQGAECVYNFGVSVRAKDGRYKYTVTDVTRTFGIMSGGRWLVPPTTKPLEYYGTVKLNKSYEADFAKFDAKVRALVASLTTAMQGSGEKAW